MRKNVATMLALIFLTASCLMAKLRKQGKLKDQASMNSKVVKVILAVVCSVLILGAAIYVAPRLQNMASEVKSQLVVPDDYPTLSDAVGNATGGDTIYVKKGTYVISQNGALVINKTLSIIGEDAAETVLSGIGFVYGTVQTKNIMADEVGITLLGLETSPVNGIILPKVAIWAYADNFKISNLTINNCDVGIIVIGNGTEISDTIMAGVSVTGSYSEVFDNNVTGALAGHDSYLSTFTIFGSYNNISHNHITNVVDGECQGSFNNIIKNAIQGDLNLKGSSNIITNNSFTTLSLTSANSNTVNNNTFSSLFLYVSSNNTIFGNTARGPANYGILMSSGSGNVFYGNYIGDYNATSFAGRSYGCGVDIGSMAKNNIFYHNNFVNNYQNLMHNWYTGMSNKNAWDNGEEGNYWSNYNSVDANGDGIGDTPFLIDHINVDHHPLMAPFDIESVNIEVPERANTSEIEKQDINLSKPFPTTSTALTSGTPITAVSIALSRKTPICQLRFISYL